MVLFSLAVLVQLRISQLLGTRVLTCQLMPRWIVCFQRSATYFFRSPGFSSTGGVPWCWQAPGTVLHCSSYRCQGEVLKNQNLLAVRFSAFPLSHLFSLKVLGSKGVSLTLGNQGSEADWPYQGAIEAAKVSFLAGDKFVVSYWPPSCRALEPTWSWRAWMSCV